MNRKVCEGIPIPNKILEMAVTQWTLTIITLMAIGIRFYSRYAITKEIGYDDGLLAGAGLLLIANLAIGFYSESQMQTCLTTLTSDQMEKQMDLEGIFGTSILSK